jgi:aspartate racemase
MPLLGPARIKPSVGASGKREEGMTMKKIGIVGGLAWPSTADYYRLICSGANAHFRALGHQPPLPSPPIMIESLNQAQTRKLRGMPDGTGWERFDSIFRDAFQRLQAAGCDFGIIASNTPHARLHAIRRGLDLPILGIVEETAREARRLGTPRALVLGTSVTMHGDLYPQHLRELGIEPIPRLPEAQIEAMQRLIDNEFYEGATRAGTRQLLEVCRQHAPDPANTAILLACTELPLAFPAHCDDASFEAEGFRFVNTSVVHARAALAEALQA